VGAGRPRIVTLLSDFGLSDGYVGAMKGVLLSQAPGITVVDLSHTIAPFDISGAAYLLASAALEFPPRTIHVAVVDPGVGSRRRLLLAEIARHYFLVPDNGLLDVVLLRERLTRCVQVLPARVAARRVAPTFHGRDLLAPAAAALARGMSLSRFGPPIRHLSRRLPLRPLVVHGNRCVGYVLHVDRFGTLILNVEAAPLERFARGQPVRVQVGHHRVTRWVRTYAEAPRGSLVALIGSQGWVEVAVVEGSAAQRLRAKVGQRVELRREGARGA